MPSVGGRAVDEDLSSDPLNKPEGMSSLALRRAFQHKLLSMPIRGLDGTRQQSLGDQEKVQTDVSGAANAKA